MNDDFKTEQILLAVENAGLNDTEKSKDLIYFTGSYFDSNDGTFGAYVFVFRYVKDGEYMPISRQRFGVDDMFIYGRASDCNHEIIKGFVTDYDVLWDVYDGDVHKVDESFEIVQVEYFRMLSEGVKPEEINEVMAQQFRAKLKTR